MPKMTDSILQHDIDRCYLCGRRGTSIDPLVWHHVFFGPYRKKSEQYGLKIRIHNISCHIYGANAVHVNSRICRRVQSAAQRVAMRHYSWTTEDFISLFGKNYTETEDVD